MLKGPMRVSDGEIVSGNGTVIDLSGAASAIIVSGTAYISGCTVTRSSTEAISDGGLFVVSAGNTLSAFDCVLSGASANYGGGLWLTGSANLTSCTTRELRGGAGGGYYLRGGRLTVSGCDLVGTMVCRSASDIKFTGSNLFSGRIIQFNTDTTATVTIAPGAVVDITGSTHAAPIAPGGGITFEVGGATVLYSSGTVSGSYMMDNVTLPAGATLTNSGSVKFTDSTTSARISGLASGVILEGTQTIWINLTGSAVDITVESGATINVSAGRTITNTTVSSGGRVNAYGTVNGGTIASGGQMRAYPAAGLINNVTVLRGGVIYVSSGGTANEPIISSGGAIRVFSGGTALLVTSNTGATITTEDGSYITYK